MYLIIISLQNLPLFSLGIPCYDTWKISLASTIFKKSVSQYSLPTLAENPGYFFAKTQPKIAKLVFGSDGPVTPRHCVGTVK